MLEIRHERLIRLHTAPIFCPSHTKLACPRERERDSGKRERERVRKREREGAEGSKRERESARACARQRERGREQEREREQKRAGGEKKKLKMKSEEDEETISTHMTSFEPPDLCACRRRVDLSRVSIKFKTLKSSYNRHATSTWASAIPTTNFVP